MVLGMALPRASTSCTFLGVPVTPVPAVMALACVRANSFDTLLAAIREFTKRSVPTVALSDIARNVPNWWLKPASVFEYIFTFLVFPPTTTSNCLAPSCAAAKLVTRLSKFFFSSLVFSDPTAWSNMFFCCFMP